MGCRRSLLLQLFLSLALLLLLPWGPVKADPDPLQDHCIADTRTAQTFFANGAPCIDPEKARSTHFATSALSKGGDTGGNQFGFNVTLTNTRNLPGLNTLGLAMARVDIGANGLVPPHTHPRASEVTILLQGSVLVGFVDTSNRLYTQNLSPGDSFVFPKGLIHFLYNQDTSNPALAVSGLSSQNPGALLVSTASFASKPPMPNEVLSKAFRITDQEVAKIRKNLGA